MFKVLMVTGVVLAAAACCAAGSGKGFVPPQLVVRKLSKAEIAGGVERAMWKMPLSVPKFVNYRGNGFPSQKTELRIGYDNTNLYLAFRCFEQKMDKLTVEYKNRDDKVWRDDSVSVILSPANDGKSYFHIVGNVEGIKYDERDEAGGGAAWNGNWSIKIGREPTAWTAFVTIPFKELGVNTPTPGTQWAANFYRRELPHNEMSFWSPTLESFRDANRWGRVVFGGEKATIVSLDTNEINAPGVHALKVRVSNPTSKNLRLNLTPMADTKRLNSLRITAGPGEFEKTVSFVFREEGKLNFWVEATAADTREVLAKAAPIVVRIPKNRTRITKLSALVRSQTPPREAVTKQKDALLAELQALLRQAVRFENNTEKWAELASKIDSLELKARSLQFACADKKGIGYAIGTETALRKVMRDKIFEGRFDLPAKISACRNEFESTQVVICAYNRSLKNVHMSVTDLVGPDGALMPASSVQLNIVDFVETRKPMYEIEYIGWYPDPLLEYEPFDAAEGGIRPIWVTVHVPKDAKPGTYRGEVVIKPEDAAESRIPLEIRVWDFELPITPTFKTAFALFPHEIGAWWGDDDTTGTQARYKFLLDRKINPTNIYSSSPLPEMKDIPFCVENGLNAMCLAYTHNRDEKGRREFAEMLRPYEKFLKEKGWWDKAYLYGFDEIPPDKYHELRDMYAWVKSEFPDLPRMCTVVPNPDLKGYVDIWVPLSGYYKQDVAEEYVKAGDQVWWYVCCHPHHPHANFFIDYPAIDPRIIFWQCWKYRIPGFLYYAINRWESNRSVSVTNGNQPLEDPEWQAAIRSGKRWPEVKWNSFAFAGYNGDGLLVYPGPAGRLLSSVRLECIRDGIEDYEYFQILDNLVKKAEAGAKCDAKLIAEAKKMLGVREEVVRSVTEYTMDPETLLRARAEVAEMIEKMRKQLAVGG